VLSGGGSHGAFQVGVIKRLIEMGHRWDVVAGVSVGAVNAMQMAMYSPMEQHVGSQKLEQFWLEIMGNQTIYCEWFGGIIAAVTGRGSLHDTSPLERFLRSKFNPVALAASGVKLRIGATSLRTGRYHAATELDHDVVKWVMASSAFPAAFTPIAIDGDIWIDGGVRDTTPVRDALATGATVLDVVLADPIADDGEPWDLRQAGSAINVGVRAATIMSNEVFRNDLRDLEAKGVKHKLYAPYATWTVGPLDFVPSQIRHMIDVGYGIP
jgi:NTE family protein